MVSSWVNSKKTINAIGKGGETALHVACFHKASSEVINVLLGKLDEKAINAIDIIGSTALHIACENGASSSEVISGRSDKLNETTINAINDNGDNALLYACKSAFLSEVINAILTHIHGKRILKLHDLMEANDPTASLYPNQLLQSILNLPSEDRDEFDPTLEERSMRRSYNHFHSPFCF
jgi:ankyrin repeat protein